MGDGHPGRRIPRMPFSIKSWRRHDNGRWPQRGVAILAAISRPQTRGGAVAMKISTHNTRPVASTAPVGAPKSTHKTPHSLRKNPTPAISRVRGRAGARTRTDSRRIKCPRRPARRTTCRAGNRRPKKTYPFHKKLPCQVRRVHARAGGQDGHPPRTRRRPRWPPPTTAPAARMATPHNRPSQPRERASVIPCALLRIII